MIEFEGEFESDHSRDELWNYFTDPDILATCTPGCKEMELESSHELSAVMSVGVGSVKPTFDVDVTVTDATRPERLEMHAGGNASRNSFETTATMVLTENDDGTTTATWNAQANVSGLIASLGQRALDSVSSRLVNNFFTDLEQLVEEGVAAHSKLEAKPDATANLD